VIETAPPPVVVQQQITYSYSYYLTTWHKHLQYLLM
jgi:hypothetical protein